MQAFIGRRFDACGYLECLDQRVCGNVKNAQ